jgi:hypothetical protein
MGQASFQYRVQVTACFNEAQYLDFLVRHQVIAAVVTVEETAHVFRGLLQP